MENPREVKSVLVQNYLKIYPRKVQLFKFTNPVTKNLDCYDPVKRKNILLSPLQQQEILLERSLRRSKRIISDLVLCNDFDLFTTFTFAKDRYNIEKSKTKMSNWLQKTKKNSPNLQYLIVPEFHKDKKALHFHALMKNLPDSNLTDSGKKINGRIAYNIHSYKSGFSSAVKIDNPEKVSSYVRKYITKDMPQFTNKKRFWTSKKLTRPRIEYNFYNAFNAFDLKETFATPHFTIYEAPGTMQLSQINT